MASLPYSLNWLYNHCRVGVCVKSQTMRFDTPSYGDIGLSARFCLSFDTPSSYRLPFIYKDKYEYLLKFP